jgi:hypothetical protein
MDSLNLYMVETMDEVLKLALAEPLPARLPAESSPVEPAVTDDTITH